MVWCGAVWCGAVGVVWVWWYDLYPPTSILSPSPSTLHPPPFTLHPPPSTLQPVNLDLALTTGQVDLLESPRAPHSRPECGACRNPRLTSKLRKQKVSPTYDRSRHDAGRTCTQLQR